MGALACERGRAVAASGGSLRPFAKAGEQRRATAGLLAVATAVRPAKLRRAVGQTSEVQCGGCYFYCSTFAF